MSITAVDFIKKFQAAGVEHNMTVPNERELKAAHAGYIRKDAEFLGETELIVVKTQTGLTWAISHAHSQPRPN